MQEVERWLAVAGFLDLDGCTVCMDDATAHSLTAFEHFGS